MSDAVRSDCQNLLREIEARDGRLRLDREDFLAEHNDPAWDDAVMGGRPPIPQDQKPIVSMFNSSALRALRGASAVLVPEYQDRILEMTVGWTSVPVFDACAVRRDNATAIALNIRLNNILIPANVLYSNLLGAIASSSSSILKKEVLRIKVLLSAASKDRLDEVLADIHPFANWEEWRLGHHLTQPQVLFSLLHEYGHHILGHFDHKDFWSGHTLSSRTGFYFNPSQSAELEADRFALEHILDNSLWKDIIHALPDGGFDFFGNEATASWLIPSQILYMFACFHMAAPIDEQSYYQVPREHPHPFDRMQQVLQFLSMKPFFNLDRAKFITGILQGTFS